MLSSGLAAEAKMLYLTESYDIYEGRVVIAATSRERDTHSTDTKTAAE